MGPEVGQECMYADTGRSIRRQWLFKPSEQLISYILYNARQRSDFFHVNEPMSHISRQVTVRTTMGTATG